MAEAMSPGAGGSGGDGRARRPSRLPSPAAYAAHRDAEQTPGYELLPSSASAVTGDHVGAPISSTVQAPPSTAPGVRRRAHGQSSTSVPRRRRSSGLWVGLLVVLLVAGGSVAWAVASRASRPDQHAVSPGQAPPPASIAATPPSSAPDATPPPAAGAAAAPSTRTAVEAMLAARAVAVRHGDATAITSTAAGGDAFSATRLAALPLRAWGYHVDDVTTTADSSRFDVEATLDYRLAGEPAPTSVAVSLVVADTPDGWRVESERSSDGSLLWEVGRPTTVTGDRTLVIGVGPTPGGRPALEAWARDGDDAIAAIRSAIPGGWPGRLTLVVPATSEAAAVLTGRSTESLDGLAAVTMAQAPPAGRTEHRVFRVYLDTPAVTGISEQARQIVLRHEVTHVATGAPATNATALWLEEGYAQYLGYRGSGVPLRVAVRDLRADRLPTRPPGDEQFSGSSAAAAYEAAHVLCVVMADRVGERGLLQVYRRTADGRSFVAAWRSVDHDGQGSLFAAWRDRMRAEVG